MILASRNSRSQALARPRNNPQRRPGSVQTVERSILDASERPVENTNMVFDSAMEGKAKSIHLTNFWLGRQNDPVIDFSILSWSQTCLSSKTLLRRPSLVAVT